MPVPLSRVVLSNVTCLVADGHVAWVCDANDWHKRPAYLGQWQSDALPFSAVGPAPAPPIPADAPAARRKGEALTKVPPLSWWQQRVAG